MTFKLIPATMLKETYSDLDEVGVPTDELGAKRSGPNGQVYEFVEFADSGDAGDVVETDNVEFHDDGGIDELEVTSSGGTSRDAVRGVAVCDHDEETYGWIQISGECELINQDGDVSEGDEIESAGDGDATAQDGNAAFGIATADYSSTTSATLIPRS